MSPRCGTRICTRESAQHATATPRTSRRSSGSHRHQHLLRHPGGRFVAVHRLEDAVDEPARRQFLDLVEDEPLAADAPGPCGRRTPAPPLRVRPRRCRSRRCPRCGRPTICCFSIALRTAVSRSRRRAARSNSSSLAAACIAVSSRLTMSSVSPSRKSHSSSTSCAVRHLIDLADARPGALLDVEQQARSAESLVLVELRRAARADREAAQQQVERVADRVRVGVRPEVPRALALAAAHHQRPRPLLVDGHGEERIALVVAQPDVEPRVVLLDEARTRASAPRPRCAPSSTRPSRPSPTICAVRGMHVLRRLEVVRQALAQIRRLADVDHAAVRRP